MASQQVGFHNTHELKGRMLELIDHLRAEMGYVTEPKARAMFEKSAAMLTGLVRELEDHERNGDESWQAGRPAFEDSEL